MDSLSNGERRILTLAMQCYETPPKVNIERLMELGGYTRGSAQVMYAAARKKLMANTAIAAGESSPTTNAAGGDGVEGGRKRKAGKAGGRKAEKVVKRVRGKKALAEMAKEEPMSDAEEEDPDQEDEKEEAVDDDAKDEDEGARGEADEFLF